MLLASLQTILAVGGGILVARILTRLIGHRIELAPKLRARLPSLETRLNSYIPNILKIIRLVIMTIVALLVCDAWDIFSLSAWAASPTGVHIIGILIHVAIILVVAALLWTAIVCLIENRLSPETGKGEPSAREKTLLALFQNALAIAFIVLTLMIVLSQIGVNIGPLIAGASVFGLAIGFGAQKLVEDIITGVFIQLENAINTGDLVSASGIIGTAEQVTIRTLRIRDLYGTYHIIPFSSVTTVSNYMRGFAYHVGHYRIAYREDIDEAMVHLRAAFDELMTDPAQKSNILERITIPGVTELADNSVKIRVMIKTKPGVQWAVGRAYNRLVKKHFDAAGIEIPVPHVALYFGQNKDGRAPPAHVELTNAPAVIEESGNAEARDDAPNLVSARKSAAAKRKRK
jgi:small conductance mechanosensitive channel